MPNGQQENEGGLSAQEAEERRLAEEERRKELQKWTRIGGWVLVGGAAIATFGGVPLVGAVFGLGAIGFFVGAELATPRRRKYCEAEITRSHCTQDWLKVGKHLCIACPKEGKCPEGTQELDMWDLPLDTDKAKETDPKCRIEIRYLTKKCKFVCEHPILVSLPPES